MMYEVVGTPKTLGFFAIFGFLWVFAAVAVLKRRGGCKCGDFRGGADTTGEIRFASVRPRRKQKRRILFASEKPCRRDYRKCL